MALSKDIKGRLGATCKYHTIRNLSNPDKLTVSWDVLGFLSEADRDAGEGFGVRNSYTKEISQSDYNDIMAILDLYTDTKAKAEFSGATDV